VIQQGANRSTAGRRLTLARWIASKSNPLTARVLVNRVWQGYFGGGLVSTPNDFGLAGARPIHPELLDWLATEFIRQGWSLKWLHRTIVLSATYRQSAVATDPSQELDAENELFSRSRLRRLTAEQLRDSLLAVSGLLNGKFDGPPVWPNLPSEILQANPAFLDDNETKTKGWYTSPAAEQPARSIFLVQKRGMKTPLLETFDLPDNQVSCARRAISTVAPQALSLLNSPLAVQAAMGLASRVHSLAGDDPEAQVNLLFQMALQRSPGDLERDGCLALLRRRSLAELCRVVLNLNEFVYLD